MASKATQANRSAGLEPGIFLLLTILLSIPFYLWGMIAPVEGLPLGLPISFLMIFVPFILSLVSAWRVNRTAAIADLFKSVMDLKRSRRWALLIGFFCMLVTAWLSYTLMRLLVLPLPAAGPLPVGEIALMALLYFWGAIPEEAGWTYTLSDVMAEKYGLIQAGVILGSVWALWHFIPWSWTHPLEWMMGMWASNILMRTIMLALYLYGGRSLFVAIVFHAMINVSMGLFPGSNLSLAPWIMSLVLFILCSIILLVHKRYRMGESA
ncbi:MAG: CPBP family intramembrane metalloprotease [Anaerolineae bacterium]|nr:CPBP family intramembrane metalloprotease [Anaerolineae bacterium]